MSIRIVFMLIAFTFFFCGCEEAKRILAHFRYRDSQYQFKSVVVRNRPDGTSDFEIRGKAEGFIPNNGQVAVEFGGVRIELPKGEIKNTNGVETYVSREYSGILELKMSASEFYVRGSGIFLIRSSTMQFRLQSYMGTGAIIPLVEQPDGYRLSPRVEELSFDPAASLSVTPGIIFADKTKTLSFYYRRGARVRSLNARPVPVEPKQGKKEAYLLSRDLKPIGAALCELTVQQTQYSQYPYYACDAEPPKGTTSPLLFAVKTSDNTGDEWSPVIEVPVLTDVSEINEALKDRRCEMPIPFEACAIMGGAPAQVIQMMKAMQGSRENCLGRLPTGEMCLLHRDPGDIGRAAMRADWSAVETQFNAVSVDKAKQDALRSAALPFVLYFNGTALAKMMLNGPNNSGSLRNLFASVLQHRNFELASEMIHLGMGPPSPSAAEATIPGLVKADPEIAEFLEKNGINARGQILMPASPPMAMPAMPSGGSPGFAGYIGPSGAVVPAPPNPMQYAGSATANTLPTSQRPTGYSGFGTLTIQNNNRHIGVIPISQTSIIPITIIGPLYQAKTWLDVLGAGYKLEAVDSGTQHRQLVNCEQPPDAQAISGPSFTCWSAVKPDSPGDWTLRLVLDKSGAHTVLGEQKFSVRK